MKRIILSSSVLVILVLAAAAGVSAQSSQQYKADIPFDFEADGRQHSAGSYRVGSVSVIGSRATGLLDIQSGKMRLVGRIAQPGNSGYWAERGTLTFLKVNDRYVLKEISTPSFKLKMRDRRIKVADDRLALATNVVKVHLN